MVAYRGTQELINVRVPIINKGLRLSYRKLVQKRGPATSQGSPDLKRDCTCTAGRLQEVLIAHKENEREQVDIRGFDSRLTLDSSRLKESFGWVNTQSEDTSV